MPRANTTTYTFEAPWSSGKANRSASPATPVPPTPTGQLESLTDAKTKSPATPNTAGLQTDRNLPDHVPAARSPGWYGIVSFHSRRPRTQPSQRTTNKAPPCDLWYDLGRTPEASKAYNGHTSGPLSAPKHHRYASLRTTPGRCSPPSVAGYAQYGDPHLRTMRGRKDGRVAPDRWPNLHDSNGLRPVGPSPS